MSDFQDPIEINEINEYQFNLFNSLEEIQETGETSSITRSRASSISGESILSLITSKKDGIIVLDPEGL